METRVELYTLIKLRGKSVKKYANALGVGEPTMRLRLKDPKRLSIVECEESDKFLDLPSGTTYEVINGNVMLNDLMEYLDE